MEAVTHVEVDVRLGRERVTDVVTDVVTDGVTDGVTHVEVNVRLGGERVGDHDAQRHHVAFVPTGEKCPPS